MMFRPLWRYQIGKLNGGTMNTLIAYGLLAGFLLVTVLYGAAIYFVISRQLLWSQIVTQRALRNDLALGRRVLERSVIRLRVRAERIKKYRSAAALALVLLVFAFLIVANIRKGYFIEHEDMRSLYCGGVLFFGFIWVNLHATRIAFSHMSRVFRSVYDDRWMPGVVDTLIEERKASGR